MDLVKWDYQESVEKMRPLVLSLKKIIPEMLQELRKAKEELSHQGARTDLTSGQMSRSWEVYCEDIGWSRRHIDRLLLVDATGITEKGTGNMENFTPEYVMKHIQEVLGEITLDPASCATAQKIIQAKKYYNEKDNGLEKPWHGKVFLNPPYKIPLIRQFVDKLVDELPNIDAAIMLTNDQTDTHWWHKAAMNASAMCCPSGRIHFYTEDKERTSPTNGQTFFYFGKQAIRFKKIFSAIGIILEVHNE